MNQATINRVANEPDPKVDSPVRYAIHSAAEGRMIWSNLVVHITRIDAGNHNRAAVFHLNHFNGWWPQDKPFARKHIKVLDGYDALSYTRKRNQAEVERDRRDAIHNHRQRDRISADRPAGR